MTTKEKIKELFDEYPESDMTFFELEKRVLNLLSECEIKCIESMTENDNRSSS